MFGHRPPLTSGPATGSYVVTLGESLGLAVGPDATPLVHAAGLRLGIGGAESNVAIGLRRLETPVTWIGRLGCDSIGSLVLRELRAEQVDLHVTIDQEMPTALMVKERPAAGRSKVQYYRSGSAGSRLSPDDLSRDLIEGASVLHCTGITAALSESCLQAVRCAIDWAKDRGRISFDVNHRNALWIDRDPEPIYRELAAASDVMFAGLDEAAFLLGRPVSDPHVALDELLDVSGGDVIVKLGSDGCLASVDGLRFEVPAIPVPVVDTVGAGDAFVAGYLAELVAGKNPAERLDTAVRCGALACLSAGDWEGLPHRHDLRTWTADADPVER